MYRPNRVRPSSKLQATTTTTTTSTTYGTPRTTTRPAPRLVLPISTTTTPATAIAAIFSTVTLTGGAVRLLLRLLLSRERNSAPTSATAATMTIQPASGLRAPA